jgi:SAM-dependent methyltransferase
MNTGPTSYQDIFSLRGAAHDEAFRRFPETSRNEVLAVLGLADPKPGESLVDLPSAGGYLSTYVQTPDLRVVAIDPSPVLHALCRQKQGLESYLAPMDALPLPTGSIDIVVCLAGLHHEPHLDQVFTEIHRVLRPGSGRLAIAEVVEGSPPGRFLNGFVHRHNSLGHEGTFLDDAFVARLPRAGFRIARNEDAHYHWTFDRREDIGVCLQLMMGIDQATPEQVIEAVASELGIDALPNGGVGMRWMLRHVLAYPA